MADLHPAYPKEGADQQDAHSRAPRNFPIMEKSDRKYSNETNKIISKMNEPDQGPDTVGGKDPWAMSPNELRGLVK